MMCFMSCCFAVGSVTVFMPMYHQSKIDGEAEYEVAEIKGHHERQGEMQYLTSFVGFDSSEDMWLTTAQLEHAPMLL